MGGRNTLSGGMSGGMSGRISGGMSGGMNGGMDKVIAGAGSTQVKEWKSPDTVSTLPHNPHRVLWQWKDGSRELTSSCALATALP